MVRNFPALLAIMALLGALWLTFKLREVDRARPLIVPPTATRTSPQPPQPAAVALITTPLISAPTSGEPIDYKSHMVVVDGEAINITPVEYRIQKWIGKLTASNLKPKFDTVVIPDVRQGKEYVASQLWLAIKHPRWVMAGLSEKQIADRLQILQQHRWHPGDKSFAGWRDAAEQIDKADAELGIAPGLPNSLPTVPAPSPIRFTLHWGDLMVLLALVAGIAAFIAGCQYLPKVTITLPVRQPALALA